MEGEPIAIAAGLSIDPDELEFSFVRASGPGGQNVNKVSSAVQLRFDAAASPSLDGETLARLRAVAGRRMTAAGTVVIIAQRHRTQDANRRDALARLVEMLGKAAHRPKMRRPTRPSKAAKTKRRETKRQRGGVKRLRGRIGPEES